MRQDDDSDVAVQRRERFQKYAPKYLNILLALVLRWTHDRELSREIAQQTMFKYFSRMEEENWQKDIKNEKAYLARMARNLVNDGWRAYGKAGLSLEELEDRLTVPDQLKCIIDLEKPIYLEELRQTIPLKTILGGLSEYQLRLLQLHEVEGLSHKEIAQEENKDTAIVRYELQKIKAKIRARAKVIFGKKSFFRTGA